MPARPKATVTSSASKAAPIGWGATQTKGNSMIRVTTRSAAIEPAAMPNRTAASPAIAYSHFSVGVAYMSAYDSMDAAKLFDRALEIQPDFAYSHLGRSLLALAGRDYTTALKESMTMLAGAPDDIIGLALSGDVALLAGDRDGALRYLRHAATLAPLDQVFFLFRRPATRLAFLLRAEGKRGEVERLLKESRQKDQEDLKEGDESCGPCYDLASINAMEGQKDEAFLWLRKAVDAGWRDYRFGSVDPLLVSLRDDARYPRLLEEVMEKVEGMRKKMEGDSAQLNTISEVH